MRVIIVGGGAAGASCAARLRRLDENAEIIILERTNEISIANCGLPYYCSDVINDREKMLVSNPTVFKELLNVEVRLNSEATLIDRINKTVKVNNEYDLSYDKLVLAQGANPIKPPIEGITNENIFTVRTLLDADRIKDYIKNNQVKNAVVVGGGFISVEMAENMIHLGLNTTLIELADQILTPYDKDIVAYVQNEMREKGINIILQDAVKAFKEKEIILNSGKEISYDIAILAIGVRPETTLAKESGLEIGQTGAIKVNEYMQTSDPNVFAAGDSVEVIDFVTNKEAIIPLAGPANRQGRIIADNITGKKSTYKKSQGTSILKVFELSIAGVGKNEKQLQQNNIEYQKIHVVGNSHAGYYPNPYAILIKLLFNKEGKILGAQSVGSEGIDKRIDVISSVMRMNGTIQDLVDSELSYAPPYSSAKDLVNIVGMTADNVLKGYSKPAFYEDLKDSYVIDVRPKIAFEMSNIEGAINIPAEELRTRLDKIPKDKKVILHCNKGFTSYVAARILQQNGFDNVYNLSGGITLYKEIVKDKQGIFTGVIPKQEMKKTDMIKIDACGLQCPGPVMKLSNTLKNINDGEIIEISTTDQGFKADIESWCKSTNNTLLGLTTENKIIKAIIQKGTNQIVQESKTEQSNGQTIVVFSNDLDKALAAMIIANGAAASGKNVTLFFTFWGLNILRKSNSKPVEKSFIDKMFGFMMPKGAEKLVLSKMNMGGMGTLMMKWVMKNKNVSTLVELIKSAQNNGVKFIACNMSMDIMGIKKEELIDGVEIAGVAKYIAETNSSNSNLFI